MADQKIIDPRISAILGCAGWQYDSCAQVIGAPRFHIKAEDIKQVTWHFNHGDNDDTFTLVFELYSGKAISVGPEDFPGYGASTPL
jgi:hypothetical protein